MILALDSIFQMRTDQLINHYWMVSNRDSASVRSTHMGHRHQCKEFNHMGRHYLDWSKDLGGQDTFLKCYLTVPSIDASDFYCSEVGAVVCAEGTDSVHGADSVPMVSEPKACAAAACNKFQIFIFAACPGQRGG